MLSVRRQENRIASLLIRQPSGAHMGEVTLVVIACSFETPVTEAT